MKSFPFHRARHSPVRADHPEIESELFDDRHGEHVPASGYHDYFRTTGVGALQGLEVRFRDMKLRVKQGAVNIHGNKTYGRRHHLPF